MVKSHACRCQMVKARPSVKAITQVRKCPSPSIPAIQPNRPVPGSFPASDAAEPAHSFSRPGIRPPGPGWTGVTRSAVNGARGGEAEMGEAP